MIIIIIFSPSLILDRHQNNIISRFVQSLRQFCLTEQKMRKKEKIAVGRYQSVDFLSLQRNNFQHNRIHTGTGACYNNDTARKPFVSSCHSDYIPCQSALTSCVHTRLGEIYGIKILSKIYIHSYKSYLDFTTQLDCEYGLFVKGSQGQRPFIFQKKR